MAKITTKVDEISEDELQNMLNSGFGNVTGSVMTAGEDKEKQGFFSPKKEEEVTFFEDNNISKDEEEEEKETGAESAKEVEEGGEKKEPETDIDIQGQGKQAEEQDEKGKGGRPSNFTQALKGLLESKVLLGFEGDENVNEYKPEDWKELIEMNIKHANEKAHEDIQNQFFQSLPPELQYAYKYVLDGGQDLKSLFLSMAGSQEIDDIDISDESGQEYAIRAFLQASGFGNSQEIEEEVNGIKDRGELEKKAKQFHPKLKAMQDQVVNQRLQYQEQEKATREEQSRRYEQSIIDTLQKGDLNGLELNQKEQQFLYQGLTQAKYPTASGNNTNALGHLLEKYQWREPNHALIAEVLLLLNDPEGYREKIRTNVKKETNKETMRTLKGVNKGGSSDNEESDDKKVGFGKRGLKRPNQGFFARN